MKVTGKNAVQAAMVLLAATTQDIEFEFGFDHFRQRNGVIPRHNGISLELGFKHLPQLPRQSVHDCGNSRSERTADLGTKRRQLGIRFKRQDMLDSRLQSRPVHSLANQKDRIA